MHKLLFLFALGLGVSLFALTGPACTGSTSVRTGAVVTYPKLVHVGPGLWVVADIDDPVFYSDGWYWLNRDGYWYRSSYYGGGWIYQNHVHVPIVVRRIKRPRIYRRYRARPGQRVRRAPVRKGRRRSTKSRRRPAPPRRR